MEARARVLLEGAPDPRKDDEEWKPRWKGGALWAAPRGELEEAARGRWPDMEDIGPVVGAAVRLQAESQSRSRKVDPEAYMAGCAGGKEWIQEFRRLHPELTVGHAWTAYERAFGASAQKLFTLKTFTNYFHSSRPSTNGSAPAARSTDRQVKGAAPENGKPTTAAPASPPPASTPEVSDAPSEVQEPDPVSPTPPVAVAAPAIPAVPEVPSYATRDSTAEDPSPPEHFSTSKNGTSLPDAGSRSRSPSKSVAIDGGDAVFLAQQRTDGRWDVELRAAVDQGLMDMLAGIIWEEVVGLPRSATA